MSEIFLNLELTAIKLITKFISDFPNKIKYKIWPSEKIIKKKRTPKDSKIKNKTIFIQNLKDIYNFIRCLENPYPNAYIEDNLGKLYFKKVRYVKKINFNKKIIFLAYREWAKNTINQLIKKIDFKSYYFFNNQRKFEKFIRNKKDFLIILIGWSNILNPKIVRDNICMGIHPSDLPNFKGGSPIQNQILKNVINTKSTLFKLNNKIDDGKKILINF